MDMFENITPQQLEVFRRENREKDYALIDVRQPDEYDEAHIPGAVLMPLDELENNLSSLPENRDILFYCRSGARSQAACVITWDSDVQYKGLYNMSGGMLAWKGHALTGMPEIGTFDERSSISDLMMRSMDLEKAAQRFYEYLLERHRHQQLKNSVEELAKAEIVHARTIYGYWKKTVDSPEPFETLYDSLKGEVLEGGEPLAQAISRIDSGKNSCMDMMEMALNIEIKAYDLYRIMADKSDNDLAQKAFLTIAQMEKKHIQSVSEIIPLCMTIYSGSSEAS